MNCNEIDILMTHRLAGELSPEQQRELDEHLASCPDCQREFQEMQTLWQLTEKTLKSHTTPEVAPLSDADYDAIIASAEQPEVTDSKPTGFKKIKSVRMGVWLQLAASVAIVAIVGIMLLEFGTPHAYKSEMVAMTRDGVRAKTAPAGQANYLYQEAPAEELEGADDTYNGAAPAAAAEPVKAEKDGKVTYNYYDQAKSLDVGSQDYDKSARREERKRSMSRSKAKQLPPAPQPKKPIQSSFKGNVQPSRQRSGEGGYANLTVSKPEEARKTSTDGNYRWKGEKQINAPAPTTPQPVTPPADGPSSRGIVSGKAMKVMKEVALDEVGAEMQEQPDTTATLGAGASVGREVVEKKSLSRTRVSHEQLEKRRKDTNGKDQLMAQQLRDLNKRLAEKEQEAIELADTHTKRQQKLRQIEQIVFGNEKRSEKRADDAQKAAQLANEVKSLASVKSTGDAKADIKAAQARLAVAEQNILALNDQVAKTDREITKRQCIIYGDAESRRPVLEAEPAKKAEAEREKTKEVGLAALEEDATAIPEFKEDKKLEPQADRSALNEMALARKRDITVESTTRSGESAPKQTPEETQKKMRDLIVDVPSFEEATIGQVTNYLQEMSKKADPNGKGITINLSPELRSPKDKEKLAPAKNKKTTDEIPTVTMVVDDIPVGEGIRYMCRAADLEYKIEKDGSITISKPKYGDKSYAVSTDELRLLGGGDSNILLEYFKNKGLLYSADCKISYDKDGGKLKIHAPARDFAKIGALIEEIKVEAERLRTTEKGLPFIDTEKNPTSTFSIDVDTASYTAARKQLQQGVRPNPESIRPEEFINYFDYHYKSPDNAVFGVYLEAAPSPFRPQSHVFRIGVQGQKLGPASSRPSVFTVLIDTSGSMAAKGRLDLTKACVKMLLKQMRSYDKITIMTCGTQTKTWINAVPVARKRIIERVIPEIIPTGVTNLEQGIVDAYSLALRNYTPGAFNRVIVFSDGIVDIGSKSGEEILARVEAARTQGISNTIVGLGGDGDDNLMETLANKGDGNYVFLDNMEEAKKVFTEQFSAKFREIARDVKIQVEFNPKAVRQYRQVGYKNRQLSKSDFRNDAVDAGEVGAGQSVTALYELHLNQAKVVDKNQVFATVRIRYKRAVTFEVEEREFYLSQDDFKRAFSQASPNTKLATSIAEFAESLRYPDVPHIANERTIMAQLQPIMQQTYGNDAKVTELYQLINAVK